MPLSMTTSPFSSWLNVFLTGQFFLIFFFCLFVFPPCYALLVFFAFICFELVIFPFFRWIVNCYCIWESSQVELRKCAFMLAYTYPYTTHTRGRLTITQQGTRLHHTATEMRIAKCFLIFVPLFYRKQTIQMASEANEQNKRKTASSHICVITVLHRWDVFNNARYLFFFSSLLRLYIYSVISSIYVYVSSPLRFSFRVIFYFGPKKVVIWSFFVEYMLSMCIELCPPIRQRWVLNFIKMFSIYFFW